MVLALRFNRPCNIVQVFDLGEIDGQYLWPWNTSKVRPQSNHYENGREHKRDFPLIWLSFIIAEAG